MENWSKIEPRGTPKTIKNELRKSIKKNVKKRAAGHASAARKVTLGGGSPYRSAPQDNNTS